MAGNDELQRNADLIRELDTTTPIDGKPDMATVRPNGAVEPFEIKTQLLPLTEEVKQADKAYAEANPADAATDADQTRFDRFMQAFDKNSDGKVLGGEIDAIRAAAKAAGVKVDADQLAQHLSSSYAGTQTKKGVPSEGNARQGR